MVAQSADKPRLKFGWLEFGPAICFAIAFTGILLTAKSCLNSAEIQMQQTGLHVAQSESRVLRRRFDETLDRILMLEQSALLVAQAYDTHDPDFAAQLEGFRKSVAIAGPEFMQVTTVDATGIVKWSTLNTSNRRIDLSDRTYFKKLSAENYNRFADVSMVGRIKGNAAWPFAFARRDNDGTFKGAIIVRLDRNPAEYLQGDLPESRHSLVTLIRRDGQLLSRSVKTDEPVVALDPTTLPKIATPRITDAGSSGFVVSMVDGIKRFVATSYNSQWSTILLVGLEPQPELEQLADAKRRVILTTALATLASLGIIFAVAAMIRRQQTINRMREGGRDLARREAVLTQIAESATDMIIMMDADFRYVYANPACSRGLGVDTEQYIGQKMGCRIGPSPMLETAMETLRRDGGALRLLCESKATDGNIHWLDLELVTVDIRVDDFISPCRYFGIARDVTARVVAERDLLASNQRIKDIMRVGPGFFYELRFETNGDFRVDMPVDPGEHLLGYTVEEAIVDGMLMRQTHPDDLEARKQAVQRCIQVGWSSAEFRVIAKDGSTHWMLRQMALSRQDETGTEMIAYVTDVTGEYDMRTRLRHSEKLATLGQLSANMAHELNQPLAALMLMAENSVTLVQSGKATPERIVEKLNKITGQVERLSLLINRVRQFSRDEHGSSSEFSVSTAVDEALSLAEARIHRTCVSIECHLAPDLPHLNTDRLLLEQVLMNLIVNACDAYGEDVGMAASDARPLIISAELTGHSMNIRVADRAGGIAPHVLPKLFEAFVTTKSARLGTGLGLFVSAANVGQIGGQITARNENGGAVFDIKLPSAMFA